MPAPVDRQPPTIGRPSSPSPEAVPKRALKPSLAPSALAPEMARCLSTASLLSDGSHGSATTRDSRDSLGSDASAASRQSSGSYSVYSASPSPALPNQHLVKRRGYVRPQGTDFAASARSRESVLSLGSIAHLQHYFSRTGLLDLKGQLERRRRGVGKARTLDLSQLDMASYLGPGAAASGTATPTAPRAVSMLAVPGSALDAYAALTASPVLAPVAADSAGDSAGDSAHGADPDPDFVESPLDADGAWYGDDDDDADPAVMLPPTVSTYMFREKPLPRPPSLKQLRADLTASLASAADALEEAREVKAERAATGAQSSPQASPARMAAHARQASLLSMDGAAASWFEIQGMHILDVMTLAIRAAKLYYTGHEHPDRLDAIKPEKEVRAELFAVMDVLKRMATRNFIGGMRSDEIRAMESWIASLRAMLDAEAAMAAEERRERATWSWLPDAGWPADASRPADRPRAYAREHAFLVSMLSAGDGTSATGPHAAAALPPWDPIDRAMPVHPPPDDDDADAKPVPSYGTPFLQHLCSGTLLVQLHNCAVRRSRRRFGAIPTFHADTQKPYRAADNLRYWAKAAELRWEVLLKIDALGIVYNTGPAVWADLEDAIYQWCRKVRAEIASDVDD